MLVLLRYAQKFRLNVEVLIHNELNLPKRKVGLSKSVMNIEVINQKIAILWQEHFENNVEALFPLLYPPLKKHSLLFIGCNPSFNEIGFRKIFKGTENENLDIYNFYLWRNRNEENIKRAAQIEIDAKNKHPYFNQFREISRYVGLDWEHIDLFLIRETDQKQLEKKVCKNRRLNLFGRRQFEIAKELISHIDLNIIIVANAFASQVFLSEITCVFDDNLGCHFAQLNGKNTPVFFTSMLTGQRALDKGSMMRLKWHIKKILTDIAERNN